MTKKRSPKPTMKNDHERLLCIWRSIEKVEELTIAGLKGFERSAEQQTAVLAAMQTIALAVRELTATFRANHREVDWQVLEKIDSIAETPRDSIDPDRLWTMVDRDVPLLKQELRPLIYSFETQV